MPMSLAEYATFLDSRNLPWPAPPTVEPVKAKPHVARLPGIKAVLWNTYGTLVSIPTGALLFEHPTEFVMDNALEKTVAEFKMWGSMSRKPGQPSEYMGKMYRDFLSEQRMTGGGSEKYPETLSHLVWEKVIERLGKKEYKYDAGQYGGTGDYAKKIAYFFHASLQGTACPPGAARALEGVHAAGVRQGLLGDGQPFTTVQLQRGLDRQDAGMTLDDLMPKSLVHLSWEVKARKPADRLFKAALAALAAANIGPSEVLHVGSRIVQDVAPARKLGMRTALFAGDKSSLAATAEQMKDPALKPDLLLTELEQITDVVGG